MEIKKNKSALAWKKFLRSETLRSNLIAASLYMTAWESLRTAVIDQLRGFFAIGYKNGEWICGERYHTEVLSRHKSPFRASLLWFREMNAIEDQDLDIADGIREHRNDIAHNLPNFILCEENEIDLGLFKNLLVLVSKIDRWWIREVEVPTNPDFDEVALAEADFESAMSGRMIILNLMITLATGEDDEVANWEEELSKVWKS